MPDVPPPPLPDDSGHAVLAFAEAVPIGIVALEHDRIAWLNATARTQFGDPAHALQRHPVAVLFDDARQAGALFAESPPVDRQLVLRRTDGSTFRAEVGVRLLHPGGEARRMLTVCDLSESDRIRAQLAHQHDELQAMTHRLMSVQEDERRTLSRELHDDIGQQITAIKLGAMALRNDDDPARRAEIVAEIIEITDQTVAKVRNLSLLLRPPQLDALGLEAALRWQADTMFRNAPPRLVLDIEPLPERPPPAVELACFRIAQEALTNVLRHADARNVHLVLARTGDVLRLEVHDDGAGFANRESAGLGLMTMRERAQQLGGTIEIGSAPQTGTRVRACLPLRL